MSSDNPAPGGTDSSGDDHASERVARTLLRREACSRDPGDSYLSLRDLSTYSGISVRKLRAHLKDPTHPLPCFRVGGGKLLVRRSDFDAWMVRFRTIGDADLDAMVHEVLRDVV